ncbi:MAG: peptidoglycan-associated lipoprotein Pal [Deltaproteobacteria bacterium]|nr:peptidoglycan-associated lipoprotein Pal [Deltaproteobacteria bacterium]
MKSKLFILGSILFVGVIAGGCAKQSTKKTAKGLNKVHFDYDQSTVKAEYEDELKGNAEWLKSHSSDNLTIEGHADERGTYEYNIALGDRRAKSAKRYLTNAGVSTKRLETVSYGEERPAAKCHDEGCRWKNRRAEFVK